MLRGPALVLAASICLAGLSVALVPWATTYDPWAWIVWGREVAHLELHTADGPSWKPLPVLFTVPFSFAGDLAPALWLVVARAGGLLALVTTYLAGRRLGGPVAATVATLALALNLDFERVVWLGSSEGLLIAATLGAIERHLAGSPRAAFAAGVAAALLRPEAWPFVFAYGAWLGWKNPALRRPVVAAFATIGFLWLGPELWGSGQLLRAAERAQQPVADAATFAPNPAAVVIERAEAMLFGPVQALAIAGIGFAALSHRRERGRATLAVALLAAAWLALVALMTLRGFSGNSRYVMAPAALLCLVAGVGATGAAESLARLLRRAGAASTLAAACAAGLIAAGFVPFALGQAHELGARTAVLEYQVDLREQAGTAIERFGGAARVRACGTVATEDYSVPMLAWMLDVPIAAVRLDATDPGVVFRARPGPAGALDPPVPRGRGFAPAVRTRLWRVFSACGG